MTFRRTFAPLVTALGSWILASPTASALTVGELVELTGSPSNTAEQRAPSLAYDSTNLFYVVAFEDYSLEADNGADVRVVRLQLDPADTMDQKLDGSLDIEDSAGISILAGGNQAIEDGQRAPSIAFNDLSNALAVVWQDFRDGSGDIRGAQFFADTGVPLGDVLVSGVSTLQESAPEIGFAQANYLVTYRQQDGADVKVLGRRYLDDFTSLDSASLDLSGMQSGGNPAVASQGSTFFVTWRGGGQVWLTSLAQSGMVTPGAPTQLTGTNNPQFNARIAPIGAAQLYVVWQQGSPDADVFGDRLALNLNSLGPSGAISSAANDQQFPEVAGGAGGALVVWQDFRNGTNSDALYGARIQANGTVQDALGFPLMELSGGVFEPAVVKGPGDDYLIAAVRRQQGSERIFVRLVRDEDPDGTMNNTGADQVAADGETPMEVVFGPATGPSPTMGVEGLDVADGTLYTVEWTSQAVSQVQISPPDVDGDASNGHQVAAVGGEVQFSLTTCVMRDAMDNCIQADKGDVDLTVSSVEGTSVGTDTVTFQNVPPVASEAVLVGAASGNDQPQTDDDLALSYSYFDINADPEMGTTINWRSGDPTPSLERPLFQNQTMVPASALEKNNTRACVEGSDQGERGDSWDAEIVPSDGSAEGNSIRSNPIVLQNTPPFARNEETRICPLGTMLCPEFDPRTGTGLSGIYRFRDPDSVDDEQPPEVRWWVKQPGAGDFTQVPALNDQLEVPGDQVISGQEWYFTVRVNDGCSFAEDLTQSSTLTINNTAPVADAGEDQEISERSMAMLDGTGSFDDDPNDTLTFSWEQTGGAEVELDDPTSPTPSFTAPSTVLGSSLIFRLTVSDGNDIPEGEEDNPVDVVAVQVRDLPNSDMDQLDDPLEVQVGTDPNSNDTDSDGLRDDEEVDPFTGEILVNPVDADSDDDGIRDGDEGRIRFGDLTGADPFADPDEDGLPAVLDADSDDDGVPDGIEAGRTMPRSGGMSSPGGIPYAGTEGNFVADADPTTQTNPVSEDTDGDGFLDGQEDANQNGRLDEGETDPDDASDPGIRCDDDMDCPSGQSCGADGICEDGGMMNDCSGNTLADQGLECCVDANTPADPICQGTVESCPPGSSPRAIGFCTGGGGEGGGDSGGCSSLSAESGAPWLLLCVGLAWVRVRRRRRMA